jgi:hypothetical protein
MAQKFPASKKLLTLMLYCNKQFSMARMTEARERSIKSLRGGMTRKEGMVF